MGGALKLPSSDGAMKVLENPVIAIRRKSIPISRKNAVRRLGVVVSIVMHD
jgi:hypothetical protein